MVSEHFLAGKNTPKRLFKFNVVPQRSKLPIALVVPFIFGQQHGSLMLEGFCSKQRLYVTEPSRGQDSSVDVVVVVVVNSWGRCSIYINLQTAAGIGNSRAFHRNVCPSKWNGGKKKRKR